MAERTGRPASGRSFGQGSAAGAPRQRRLVIGVAIAIVAAVAVVAVVLLVVRDGGDDEAASSPIGGLMTFQNMSRKHVATPVAYAEVPPVGGDHAGALQTCGAYDQPVPNELAVHSMEHGAVWITYRPDLPSDQVKRLRSFADRSHVLVSPYPGLPSPVVASAWERQVRLDSATDDRLKRFVAQFRRGPQTPEPGASCNGIGTPLR